MLAWSVERTGLQVVRFNVKASHDHGSLGDADVILVGYGRDPKVAARFLDLFMRSSMARRIPIVAVLEKESDSALEDIFEFGVEHVVVPPARSRILRRKLEHTVHYKRLRDTELNSFEQAIRDKRRAEAFGKLIVPLGVAMMAETDFDRLLELILTESKKLCNADGGTLYLVEGDRLQFQMVLNDSLDLYRSRGEDLSAFKPISLRDENGRVNRKHIAAFVANTGESANVRDAYEQSGFDFRGTREFDARSGYRTKSVLAMPLKAKDGHLIGVLQLINAKDPVNGETVVFDPVLQTMAESLSLLAAQALQSYLKNRELQERVNAMAIEVDENTKREQVQEITDSAYFKSLKQKARTMRVQVGKSTRQEV